MSAPRRVFPMEVKRGSVRVKIYRVTNKQRTSFTVSWFGEGRRQLKMFADLEEAQEEARSKALSLSRGEVDVLTLRSADRLAYSHAMEALRATGVPLELAAKEFAAASKELGGRTSLLEAVRDYVRRHPLQLIQKDVPEAVQEFFAAKEAEGASKIYLKVLRVYLGQFAERLHCSLTALTQGDIADFLREMKVSGRSKNNARQAVGAFFKFCKERGWLPRDHEGIGLVPKFKESPGEIEIFTPAELRAFLTYARPEMIPFLAIGAFAGLRSAEIERLDWSEVHLAERFIEVKAAKAKTASRRIVPISENLALWLTPYAQSGAPVVPFENVSKQLGWLVEATNNGLKAAAEEASEQKKEEAPQQTWKKNALRHSFISYRVAAIQNVNQVALECGNSPAIIFRHYRELVRPTEAEKWFAIAPN
jgi:integrase